MPPTIKPTNGMRHLHRHTWPLILLAAGLPAGCSVSDGDPATDSGAAPATQDEIRLHADVWQVMDGTRATTYDSNIALQSEDLKIDAYYHDTETKYLDGKKLHYDTDDWKFWEDDAQLKCYWPIVGSVYDPADANITVSSLDFVGYCPYNRPSYIPADPTYNYSTGVSFTCDLSSYMTLASQTSMPEFLVGILDAQTYTTQTAAGGALPLQFKHPFALIKFVITAASGTNVKINSISIDGLKTGGTCAYDGTTMSWSSLTGSATMTLTQELKNGDTTEGTPFLVIPNNYGSKYLTVNATWNDWSNVTISDYGTNVDFNWQAGYIYTYNLTLDKYGLKVDIAKYTEQW